MGLPSNDRFLFQDFLQERASPLVIIDDENALAHVPLFLTPASSSQGKSWDCPGGSCERESSLTSFLSLRGLAHARPTGSHHEHLGESIEDRGLLAHPKNLPIGGGEHLPGKLGRNP